MRRAGDPAWPTDRGEYRAPLRAAGCHYFLRKPYDPSVLLVLIYEALRQMKSDER